MNKSTAKTKQLVILSMFCAIAYVVMALGRIPIVLFLKYDPKDIIITIAGFLFGAPSALAVSAVVSVVVSARSPIPASRKKRPAKPIFPQRLSVIILKDAVKCRWNPSGNWERSTVQQNGRV